MIFITIKIFKPYHYLVIMQQELKVIHQVLIIGAGLSGLTAADQIIKQNPQASLLILQAMDQPGGRTKSIDHNGVTFDLGAQWVGKPQKYVLDLIERAELETVQQYTKGNKYMELGKELSVFKTNIPMNVGFIPLIQMQLAMWKIDKMAKTVPLENPRDCPNAVQWDSITIHSWIQQNIWFQKVRKLVEVAVRSVLGCQTNEVSALFFLWYIHQNHGFETLINVQNGLQQTKIVKGTQSLSKFLAKQIIERGGKIQFNSFVTEIKQSDKQVQVKTRKGDVYHAKYLVIAAPPAALKNISFEPQLSRERRFIRDRYVMGSYSKMIVTYNKSYWREKGLSGEVISDCHEGPIMLVYDQTRFKQNGQPQPALVVFICGFPEQQWTVNQQQCKKTVIEKLASYFKCEQMLSPTSTYLKVWNTEQSIQGAPTAFTPPGVLTRIQDIRQPEGRIHWAGTETARISQGYMDGAIQSGIRVSRQVIDRLNGIQLKKEARHPTSKWYSKIETFKRSNWIKRLFWW